MPFRNKRCSHVRFSFFSIGVRSQRFRPGAGKCGPALHQGGILLKGRGTPTKMLTGYSGYFVADLANFQMLQRIAGVNLHDDTADASTRWL